MPSSAQPPYHAAKLMHFLPTHEHQMSHPTSVQTHGHSQRTLFVQQYAPPFEGSMQVVDRFMLQTISVPPAHVFEVHNMLRQPVSKYVCSYNPLDLNRAAQACAQAVAQGAPPSAPVGQLVDVVQQNAVFYGQQDAGRAQDIPVFRITENLLD